jgi:hypothetical protein
MNRSVDPTNTVMRTVRGDDVDALLGQIQALVARRDELDERASDDATRAEALEALDGLQWKLARAARAEAERMAETASGGRAR